MNASMLPRVWPWPANNYPFLQFGLGSGQGLQIITPFRSKSSLCFRFSDKAVVSLISDTIQTNYKEHAPNWSEASKTIKKHWWEYFLLKVTFEPPFEAQVKAAWEAAMKTRLRQMVYRAGRSKGVPRWMDESLHKKVLDRTLEESFKDKSSKNSANRKSGGDEKGKAPATHAMGRMNAVQLMVKMAGPDLNLPTVTQMLKATKQNKQGSWLTPKAGTLHTKVIGKKAELESQGVTDIDENAIYHDEHGGYNKKGGFYGLGSAAEDYFERPRPSTSTPSDNHYSPGLYSKMASENKRLSATLNDATQRLASIEKFLSQQFGHNITENCSNNILSQRRNDDLDGDGHGGNTTSPTPFTPWSSSTTVAN